jgi:hypothetical protein
MFQFGDRRTLRVDCPWRIIRNQQIAHGYEDDGRQFGLPAPVDGEKRSLHLLFRRSISNVALRVDSADLSIEFEGGARLELFNASSGYEGWECSTEQASFIAQGGGNLVFLSNPAGL